jgi:uncharacterized protein YndB with AHSA1/START domain
MNESERVLIEVTLPAPIDAVWRALRDHDELRRWFGWQYDGLDDEIRMIFDGAVEQVSDAERTLSWEPHDWDHGERFTLEPDGQHTRLRVTQAARADGASWDDVYDEVNEGWIMFVQQLRLALVRHPGEDRRTLYLDGHAVDVDAFPVEAALGITDIAALTPGSPYDTRAETGDALTGDVWYHTAHQFGVTVEQFGNGLLIVGNHPPSARPPHGGGWVLITTYGLDHAAFAELEQRWTGWWSTRYKPGGDTA